MILGAFLLITTEHEISAYKAPVPREVNFPNGIDSASDEQLQGVFSDCTDKSGTSCSECVSTPQSTYFGKVMISTPCRWCVETQECHAYGSLEQSCSIPVHTNDIKDLEYTKYVCDASIYPHLESDFSNTDIDSLEQWVINYMNNFLGSKHEFMTYEDDVGSGVYNLADGSHYTKNEVEKGVNKKATVVTSDSETIKIAIASDWGSGTWESAAVASLIADYDADYTIHMGDVYYEAMEEELNINLFGEAPNDRQVGVKWPVGKRGSFHINGNHEMLSLGNGYFDHLLPNMNQKASFMSLENEYWRILGLDTGYNSYNAFKRINAIDELSETDAPQHEAVIKWLNETIKLGDMCNEDKRGIVLMSHHQPFSDFIKDDGYVGTPMQLAEFLPKDCTVIWLSGHEHEFSLYDKVEKFGDVEMSLYHRLIGNGGFPQPPQTPSKHTALKAWDNRVYKSFELNGNRQESYVYNGYMTMSLTGPKMDIEYRTFACSTALDSEKRCGVSSGPSMTESTLLGTESFVINTDTGNVELQSQNLDGELLTVVAEGESPVLLPEEERRVRQRHAFDNGQKH